MSKRQSKFSSRIGFIAAASGSAVGLGNIWKFPYEVGTYGGAGFLLLYIICIVVLGYPLVVAELAFGRKMQSGPYKAYTNLANKKWKMLGSFVVLCSLVVMSFYNVVAGWTLGYFFETIKGNLLCTSEFNNFFTEFTQSIANNFIYTSSIAIAIALIIKNGVNKGIEKWSKILMPLFLITLISLTSYALTLENALKGLKFYLIPRLSSMTTSAIYTALGQSFLSLSVGLGILITYGSYMKKDTSIPNSAAIITLSDTGVSFLAGLCLFPFIFYQNIEPSQGPSLVFISLPSVFKTLGATFGVMVGASFFLLLAFAAITSSISILEVVTTYIVERYHTKRSKAVLLASVFAFVLGIPSMLSMGGSTFFKNFLIHKGTKYDFLTFVSEVTTEIVLPLTNFLFSFFIAYQWKTKNLFIEIRKGSKNYRKTWFEKYINFMISYTCPTLLGVILIVNILQLVFGIRVVDIFSIVEF